MTLKPVPYSGEGDRLSQTVGAATTHYVLDPAAGLTQVLADGTNTYLYGNDRLAQYQAAMQYFGADGLGSVRQIFDASAAVVGSARYDPYGNVMAQSGATSVFAFAGEQQDGTGLTYLRARYYSAAQGRFTTRDVWEGDPNAPMSYNAWTYVNGNPSNNTDPSGMMPRISGVCPEPAADHGDASRPEYYTFGFAPPFFGDVGITFVYCGEFRLTAYQFIDQENRYTSAPRATTTDENGNTVTFNREFIIDVQGNGTGYSNKVCASTAGYFHYDPGLDPKVDYQKDPMPFTLFCGKGRPFDANTDAYSVVAANPGQIQRGSLIYLPYLCQPGRPCDHQWHDFPSGDNPSLQVADTGGGIGAYRLDVFTGQDVGNAINNNNLSLTWSATNAHLGTTKGSGAVGPSPVYQMIPLLPPSVIFPGLTACFPSAPHT